MGVVTTPNTPVMTTISKNAARRSKIKLKRKFKALKGFLVNLHGTVCATILAENIRICSREKHCWRHLRIVCRQKLLRDTDKRGRTLLKKKASRTFRYFSEYFDKKQILILKDGNKEDQY